MRNIIPSMFLLLACTAKPGPQEADDALVHLRPEPGPPDELHELYDDPVPEPKVFDDSSPPPERMWIEPWLWEHIFGPYYELPEEPRACFTQTTDASGRVLQSSFSSWAGDLPLASGSDHDGDGELDILRLWEHDAHGRIIHYAQHVLGACRAPRIERYFRYDAHGMPMISEPSPRRVALYEWREDDAGRPIGMFEFINLHAHHGDQLGRIARLHWSDNRLVRFDFRRFYEIGPKDPYASSFVVTRGAPGLVRIDNFTWNETGTATWEAAVIFEEQAGRARPRALLGRSAAGESEIRKEWIHTHEWVQTSEQVRAARQRAGVKQVWVHEQRADGSALVTEQGDGERTIHRYHCEPFVPPDPQDSCE